MQKAILIPLLALLASCNFSNSCSGLEDLYVPDILQAQANRSGFPYCNVLLEAKNKNPKALLKLIRFAYKTEDSSAIEHGIVFTELLLILGDDYCYNILDKEELGIQLLAAKMIDACQEYRDPSLPVETELAKTYELLLGQYD